MNKAYKFRIYPNAEQQTLFAKTFGCVRFVYNKMLGDKIDHYNETGEKLSVTPAKYKSEFEWLKEVDSLALANAQLNLNKAYNNFFRNKSIGFPKFKSKHKSRNSYTTNCVNDNIELSSGKYYASILYEYEKVIEPIEIKSTVGLDFSMTELYVDNNGNEASYPRYYRRKLEKLKKMSRTLSKMKKFSNNWYKQKQKIAVLHETIANQRKDFLHNQSRQIANSYDLVGVEDLNMKAMSQSLNFGKSVADNSWGMFRTFLKYKLEEQGKYFVVVDKWFPSSKLCSTPDCGYKNTELELSDREWTCPKCGIVHNRDVNAAVNIRNEAVRMITA